MCSVHVAGIMGLSRFRSRNYVVRRMTFTRMRRGRHSSTIDTIEYPRKGGNTSITKKKRGEKKQQKKQPDVYTKSKNEGKSINKRCDLQKTLWKRAGRPEACTRAHNWGEPQGVMMSCLPLYHVPLHLLAYLLT